MELILHFLFDLFTAAFQVLRIFPHQGLVGVHLFLELLIFHRLPRDRGVGGKVHLTQVLPQDLGRTLMQRLLPAHPDQLLLLCPLQVLEVLIHSQIGGQVLHPFAVVVRFPLLLRERGKDLHGLLPLLPLPGRDPVRVPQQFPVLHEVLEALGGLHRGLLRSLDRLLVPGLREQAGPRIVDRFCPLLGVLRLPERGMVLLGVTLFAGQSSHIVLLPNVDDLIRHPLPEGVLIFLRGLCRQLIQEQLFLFFRLT